MLQEIHLNNFAIINTLQLSLYHGMSTITGETGAGKSIIIDAIELALGGRLDNKLISNQSERCDISLCFDITSNKLALQWLSQHEIVETDCQCIVRRTITPDGRSRCFINGQPVTLQNVAELGNLLMIIHGQHQHQALLKRDQQRYILDDYANLLTLSSDVKRLYHDWSQTQDKISQLQTINLEQSTRRDFLEYQLQELTKLGLAEDELVKLHREQKALANADNSIANCQEALLYLSEQEENCALDLLQNAIRGLNATKSSDARLENCLHLLTSSALQMEEARAELRQYVAAIEINPQRLQCVEERLATIHDIARKHRIPAEQLLLLQQQLSTELQTVANCEQQLQMAQEQLQILETNYRSTAKKLSQQRKKAAADLSRMITENMQAMGMIGGQLAIELLPNSEITPQPHGLERCEFLVSANPGQPLHPLNKVASGGELSRISLATQVIIAEKVATPTLIFDEVDVGIGGKTAAIIGKMLQTLAKSTQVICITHHAQVAAFANHHFLVAKSTQKKNTSTSIKNLSSAEKIEELARMLGGIEITKQTRAHAEEMLMSCQ